MLVKYFKKEEFDCRCGCGLNNISSELVGLLDSARMLCDVPFVVNSGTRCIKHNINVGGSKTSSHLLGLACDIQAKDSNTRFKILKSLFRVGFSRILIYENFIHVDVDYKKPKELLSLM